MAEFKHQTDRKERKTSPDFKSPTRDQLATGRWMEAGDQHGVGFRTPVGSKSVKSYEKGPIPLKSKSFSPEEGVI